MIGVDIASDTTANLGNCIKCGRKLKNSMNYLYGEGPLCGLCYAELEKQLQNKGEWVVSNVIIKS